MQSRASLVARKFTEFLCSFDNWSDESYRGLYTQKWFRRNVLRLITVMSSDCGLRISGLI